MNKLNKIITLLICISTMFVYSCNKMELIKNDTAACEKLIGNWKRVIRTSSAVLSDPEFVDTDVADITFLSTTTMIFNSDNTFTLEINQELETFTPTVDDCPFTQEQVAANVNKYLKVDGTYVANFEYFQITNKSVTLADGTVYTAEEYAKYDNSVGVKLEKTAWSINDNVLVIGDEVQAVEYRRVK